MRKMNNIHQAGTKCNTLQTTVRREVEVKRLPAAIIEIVYNPRIVVDIFSVPALRTFVELPIFICL